MKDYHFYKTVSKQVLCNYLDRAVTISRGGFVADQAVKNFILNTGAKFICRAATCWSPTIADYNSYPAQKEFIDEMHSIDPDIVLEACVFEYISRKINDIPIPEYVFEEFGLPVEQRNFSFDKMLFDNDRFLDFWAKDTSVPDITKTETRMFFYYRACEYIKLGYEALHMGQVHLIGYDDTDFENWSDLLVRIRRFASENARRKFVFLNAHTHGIYSTDGNLLFDFHIFPCRPVADGKEAHLPTEDNPQRAHFLEGHIDSIYGKSLGGKTYSGWECDTMPYIVEIDNWGWNPDAANVPNPEDMMCWGFDEISWFAHQPQWYRHEFLQYALDYVRSREGEDAFFAMPCQRVAYLYDEQNKVVGSTYFGYDRQNHPKGVGDEEFIKKLWSE